MNVGSLFSGIGGIELGFEQAGFKTEWFIENNDYAKTILKKRFPDTKIYGNIEEVDFRAIPKVEILTGGFPCQDISNAGKRVGIKGSRSSLWKYYLQAISEIRPRIAFIENVSALLGRGLSVVLCDLASVGYNAEWYCVPASSVGANHQRDRIFIIAYPNNSRYIHRQIKEQSTEAREPAQCQSKSSCSDVADSDNNGYSKQRFKQDRDYRNREEKNKEQSKREQRFGISRQSTNVSNTNVKRPKRQRQKEIRYSELSNTKSLRFRGGSVQDNSRNKSKDKQSRNKSRSKVKQHLWSQEIESRICRVADGVSLRVDRIRCLGNAVVPQVAEVFAKAIKEKSR